MGLHAINPRRDRLSFSGRAKAKSTVASITRSVGLLAISVLRPVARPHRSGVGFSRTIPLSIDNDKILSTHVKASADSDFYHLDHLASNLRRKPPDESRGVREVQSILSYFELHSNRVLGLTLHLKRMTQNTNRLN
jgi:hypothetical protein